MQRPIGRPVVCVWGCGYYRVTAAVGRASWSAAWNRNARSFRVPDKLKFLRDHTSAGDRGD
jgi:hypothetical protein